MGRANDTNIQVIQDGLGVSLDTTNFDTNLDNTITDVQKLADAVDELTTSGVNNTTVNASGVIDYFLSAAIGDETTDISVATGVLTFTMPNFATSLTGVSASLVTAPTGSVATFDINEGGTSVLSTKITIDATEKTSETAATPAVISDSSIAANAIITVDIDAVGSTVAGAGGKIWLYFNKA